MRKELKTFNPNLLIRQLNLNFEFFNTNWFIRNELDYKLTPSHDVEARDKGFKDGVEMVTREMFFKLMRTVIDNRDPNGHEEYINLNYVAYAFDLDVNLLRDIMGDKHEGEDVYTTLSESQIIILLDGLLEDICETMSYKCMFFTLQVAKVKLHIKKPLWLKVSLYIKRLLKRG